MEEGAWSSKFRTLKVSGSFPRRRPRNEVIKRDAKDNKISKDLVIDKNALRSSIRNRPAQTNMKK